MIQTRGLRRTFKSRKSEVVAVAGVDLDVQAGEIFGFLGPNGTGKTTTLRMLSTLLPPSGGEATVAGADLLEEPGLVRERIGYVSQVGSSFPEVSGRTELVLLLLSGVLLPLTLAPGWLQTIADFNPLSYAVVAARDMFNGNATDPGVLKGVVIMLAVAVIGIAIGARAFNRAVA